jgi:hypothetical protein
MEMLQQTNLREWTIEKLDELHQSNKIFHDIAFNRIQAGAWDIGRKRGYIESLYKCNIVTLIVLAHIDSCLAHATNIGDEVSIEYFTMCKKNGYEYVILDGSNRIGAIKEYLNSIFDLITNKTRKDIKRTEFKGKYIGISLITKSTKAELHTHAIDLNSGVSWNGQEKRNALDAKISKFIRSISIGEYAECVGTKIDSINVKRMGEQELIANCLYYLQYGKFTNQTGLDSLYNLNDNQISNETYKELEAFSYTMFGMFKNKNKMKFKKSFYLYMFALLKVLDSDGFEIVESESMNFFNSLADAWIELDSDNTTLYYSDEKKQSYTWSNLMGFISLETNQKISILLNFVYTNKQNCLAPKRNNKRVIDTGSNSKVRYDIAKRDGCKVRVNGKINGVWFNPDNIDEEYIVYLLHEVIKSSDINVDHILSLNGPSKGEDSIHNMELATADYNKWKRAKI